MFKDKYHIGVKAFGFGLGTGLSRILGLAREILFAYLFGAGMIMDAFRVAFNIPNLLRDLLAEGTLTPAFVPILSDYYTKEGKDKANNFASLILGAMIIITGIITIIGILFAGLWTKIVAFGFTKDIEKFTLTVRLTRTLFPFLILITISALIMGILNFRNHFFVTGVAPCGFDIGIIICGLALAPKFGIISIALGVIIGGALQILIQLPTSFKEGFNLRPIFNLKSQDVRKVLLLMMPIAIGYSATKINTVVNTLIASFLEHGAISYLSYAFRLIWLPIGVIGVALANVALPVASEEVSLEEIGELKNTLFKSIEYCVLITVPVVLLTYFLAEPVCKLLYGHGEFTQSAVINTADAIKFYSASIVGLSLTRIFASFFYAMKDTKTPMRVSFYTVGINAIFALTFVKFIGFRALALATSMASLSNAGILFFLLMNLVKIKLSKQKA